MTEHKGLPVAGYKPTQSAEAVELVTEGKQIEERVRRYIDKIAGRKVDQGTGHPVEQDPRRIAMARSYIEIGFVMAFKAVFQPGEGRIDLPEDIQTDRIEPTAL